MPIEKLAHNRLAGRRGISEFLSGIGAAPGRLRVLQKLPVRNRARRGGEAGSFCRLRLAAPARLESRKLRERLKGRDGALRALPRVADRTFAWLRNVAALAGLFVLLATATPVVRWWGRTLAGQWSEPGGEVLVVLGGAVQRDGYIGLNSYWRSVYAIRAWRTGKFQRIVISGGGSETVPIAIPMRDFLVANQVPGEVITVETKSMSTHENARFTAPLLAGVRGPVVLLTSDYHMYRALRSFEKAGVNVKPRPIPDALMRADRPSVRWLALLDLATETVKIVYYKTRGWI